MTLEQLVRDLHKTVQAIETKSKKSEIDQQMLGSLRSRINQQGKNGYTISPSEIQAYLSQSAALKSLQLDLIEEENKRQAVLTKIAAELSGLDSIKFEYKIPVSTPGTMTRRNEHIYNFTFDGSKISYEASYR